MKRKRIIKSDTKLVQVDSKTFIEVAKAIPDDEAFAKFIDNTEYGTAFHEKRIRRQKTNL